jgi:hypothetical protein
LAQVDHPLQVVNAGLDDVGEHHVGRSVSSEVPIRLAYLGARRDA